MNDSDITSSSLVIDAVVVERGERVVLDGVSARVDAGEILAVRGENGSGKTTLLRAVAGLTRPVAGSIRLGDIDLPGDRDVLSRHVAMVSHAGGLMTDVPIAVSIRQWRSLHASLAEDEAQHWFERLGIADLIERRPFEMSQGQQRRCALACLVVRDASVWLLDEPMAALDASSREIVDELVRDRLAKGHRFIVSTHDDWPADAPTTRTLVLGRSESQVEGEPA